MPADSHTTTVRPARSRVARRATLLMALVALLLIVRLIWGHYAAAALRAQVERVRAAGGPVEAADLPFEAVPDAENAAVYLNDAAAAFVNSAIPPRASNNVYAPYPPYGDAWMADAGASEQAHGKLFALSRQARQHARAQWRQAPIAPPLINAWATRHLNSARNLANTLADGAEYAHLFGNDAEAIERLRDVLHLSRCVRQDQTLVGQLVAIGIDALACSATQTIAPGLHLEPSPSTSAPATRAAARALIAELLDESSMRRGLEGSFGFERALMHEMRRMQSARTWVIRPLADAQLVRDHRNADVKIDAARLANKPQVSAALARMTVEEPYGGMRTGATKTYRDVPRYSRWFGTPTSVERIFDTNFRVTSERRMAAAALAAQLFRADHGRWPASLDELVPNYLPAVPLDPFTDGTTIGYVIQSGGRPDGAGRPMVFVRNGEIDNGPYPEPSYWWEADRRPGVTIRKELWQYRDLTHFSPPATQPASTQAVDDEPQEPNAPGEQPQ